MITPILAISSPEKRCGKTTLLKVLKTVTRKPELAANISQSAVFRCVDKWQPTLLVDEADSFLRDNEELRGILNSGHDRFGANVIRNVGDKHEPKRFSTWAPKAIALIGRLPDTLTDRSIMIRMQRKAAEDQVEKFRLEHTSPNNDIARMCQRWSEDNLEEISKIDPEIPNILANNDRAADNWRPLLGIAQIMGVAKYAHEAIQDLHEEDDDAKSISNLLLDDIRDLFQEANVNQIASMDLAEKLVMIEGRPWAEWKGRGISPNQVARLLKPFNIRPKSVRGQSVYRGYKKEWFKDAWRRYSDQPSNNESVTEKATVPRKPTPDKGGHSNPEGTGNCHSDPSSPSQSVTPLQLNNDGACSDFQSVTPEDDVTPWDSLKPPPHNVCNSVTVQMPPKGKNCSHCVHFSVGSDGTMGHCGFDGSTAWPDHSCDNYKPELGGNNK